MNDRRLTDAQLASGLRRHLSARPDAGVHTRILAEVEVTPQVRPWPSILGGAGTTGVLGGRRGLLVAAALLLALLVATGAAVGAFLEWQRREAVPELSLEPPDDLAAYMSESSRKILDMPALKLVMSDGDIWYHDGAGTVRQDRPLEGANGVTWLYTRSATVEVQRDARPVNWVVGPPGGVDPRAQIILSPPCCGLDPECATGWEYVGLEYVVGRPTHHIACGFELWIDVELGIPLRGQTEPAPQPSSAGPGPSPAATEWTVVVLEVGPQAAALFAENPDGLPVLSAEQQQCAFDASCTSPEPTPAPRPFAPPPAASGVEAPTDLAGFVADVRANGKDLPALELIMESYTSPPTGEGRSRHLYDGKGSSRDESFVDGRWEVAWINIRGRAYEFFAGRWHDYGPGRDDIFTGWTFGLPDVCDPGWEHRGVDTVLDRPAHHLVCGLDKFWVDDEWHLVTRVQHDPDALGTQTSVEEVVEVTFAEQPADLFVLPAGADVFCPRCASPKP